MKPRSRCKFNNIFKCAAIGTWGWEASYKEGKLNGIEKTNREEKIYEERSFENGKVKGITRKYYTKSKIRSRLYRRESFQEENVL